MNRTQQRQLARVVGWRGSKAKRTRTYPRPEFAPYEEPVEEPETEE